MMDFVNTITGMFEFGWNPLLNWVPVIEADCDGHQERYLIEDPYTTMSNGNIYKVPLITGITEYEFYNLGYCRWKEVVLNNFAAIFFSIIFLQTLYAIVLSVNI